MSMEAIVLSDRRLTSLAEWQQAIDEGGLHTSLPTDSSIEDLEGFLPVHLNSIATGFECDHCDVQEILTLYHEVDFGRRWPYGLAFRWAGDFDAFLAAYIAAAAYAKASDGVLFDPQESLIMSPSEALARALEVRRDIEKLRKVARATAERVGRAS